MRLPARPTRMTSDEFIAWAMEQPEGERYELVAGEVVAMSPERLGHARTKHRIARALEDAVSARRLPCEVLPDGVTVVIDDSTTFEPDALVRCGEPLPDEAVQVVDPLLVVEVTSPSSSRSDRGAKLEAYFRVASIAHYLIVKIENRTVIHHRKDAGGLIHTRVLKGGPLELDPPGLAVAVEAFFV